MQPTPIVSDNKAKEIEKTSYNQEDMDKAMEKLNREFAAGDLMGWICPKCGAVMSPYQRFCVKCSGNWEITYGTETKPSNWETVYTGFRTENE